MFYSIARFVVKILDFLAFNTKVIGAENIPAEGNFVLIANHMSFYDPISIAVHMRRRIHFIAKEELYRNPILRAILLGVKTIPVNREKVGMKTLKDSLQVLKDGEVLGIFPEGTRVKNQGDVKPMDGFVLFAQKTQSPILPIHISGTYKFRGKIQIVIGEPLELRETYKKRLNASEMSDLSKKVMDIVYDLK